MSWSCKTSPTANIRKKYDTSDAERTKVSCERKFFAADAEGIDGVDTL